MSRHKNLVLIVLAVFLLAASLWNSMVGPIGPSWPSRAEAEIVRQMVGGSDVILGALIGGGSAAVAAYLADRRRFKREDKYRDYADRRQVYSEFVSRWTLYEAAVKRTHPGLQGLQEREEAHLELLRSFSALPLIAPEEVRAAAVSVLKEEKRAPGRFWKATQKDLDKWPPRRLEEVDDEGDR